MSQKQILLELSLLSIDKLIVTRRDYDIFGRVMLTGTCRNTFNYSSPFSSSAVKIVGNSATSAMKEYGVTGVSLLDIVVWGANYYGSQIYHTFQHTDTFSLDKLIDGTFNIGRIHEIL